MKIPKNIITFTIPALLAVALAAAVVWGKSKDARAKELEAVAEEYMGRYVSACARCSEELSDSVDSMSVSLEKLRVTGSVTARVLALEDIVRESAEAQKLISRLPRSQVDSMGISAFLTRIGDYARSLSRRLLSGEELPESDAEQLDALVEAVAGISERLNTMLANGEMPVGTEEYDYYDTEADGEEQEYPTLLYDGPFAEAVEKAEPLGLTGEEGSMEEAKAFAEKALNIALEYDGDTEGRMPTYEFTGGGYSVSVTKKGLHLKSFMGAPTGNESGKPDEEGYNTLAERGRELLAAYGYADMEPTYSEARDGTVLISYVWKAGDVLVYNDMVKLWLDRETGEPVGMDAANYLFSHHKRELPVPKVTKEEALAAISGMLEMRETGLALIPLTPLTEALCYEIRGSFFECEFIVYINAVTGAEERIFKLVKDDCGEKTV